jgi:16S rRNA (guanine527-N7)-methyltransferase
MPEDPWARLDRAIAALGVAVDPGFPSRARLFLTELAAWTRVARLTGYRTLDDRIDHLLVESLLFLRVVPEPASPVIDIGTGAGVPGLVLQMARPAWTVWFIEANRRRANFVRHVLRILELDPAAVYQDRAERLGPGTLRGRARTVTLRAVAGIEDAIELGMPFLAVGGHLVLSLGPRRRSVPPGARVERVRIPAGSRSLPLDRAFLILGRTTGR